MLVTTRTKIIGTTAPLLLAAITLLLAVNAPVFALGQGASDSMDEMKVPQTSQDHQEMAEHYQKVEAQTRKDIEMHKKMLAEFGKTVAKNPKSPSENPYTRRMRLHCERYIRAAEALASEAAESAKFHAMRAKELGGK